MPAGWYPDPFSNGGYVRWWDGQRWGQSTTVVPGQAPPPPPPGAPRSPAGQGQSHFPADGTVDDGQLARYGQRVAAYVLDALIQAIVLIPIVMWLEGPLYSDLTAALEANNGQLTQAIFDSLVQKAQENSLWVTVATLAVTFIYVVPQIALYGRTLGKRAIGIRVRSLDGDGAIGWRQSVLRWMIQGVGWAVCSLLLVVDLLWPLWDRPLRQTIHDKGAKTIVVKDRA